MNQSKISPSCIICGSASFGPGPLGRLSSNGALPHCTSCGSLERHRAVRSLFNSFSADFLIWRKGLQISPDPALTSQFFNSYEISIFEEGGIDLRQSNCQNNSYDFITLSHVLESIDDDHAAIHELIRMSSDLGLIHLVLADPLALEESVDYESAKGPYAYHHRYGKDFSKRFSLEHATCKLTVVNSLDMITGSFTANHFITKSDKAYKDLHDQLTLIESQNGMGTDFANFHFIS